MKNIKKILIACLVLVMCLPMFAACSKPTEGVVYEFSSDGTYAIVTGYEGSDTNVVIAKEYEGVPVKVIGARAFQKKVIYSVDIPDSVVEIEYSAFASCGALKSVSIPNSVETISSTAFYGCAKLIKVVNGVSYVDNWVIDCDESVTSVILKKDTVGIIESAFSDCSSLENINIPDGVTSIGNYAFDDCSSLESINIPDGVTSIGNYAFDDCSSLESITIPNSVKSIGNSAFSGCTSLVYHQYDHAYYLGNKNNPYFVLVKSENTSITSCKINDSTKFICSSAFNNCYRLTSVTIGSSVTSIGNSAFYGCSNLKSINFKGTKAQWQAITMGSNAFGWWYSSSPMVNCTDGSIESK